jgi:DnaJ-class molecular chaperone
MLEKVFETEKINIKVAPFKCVVCNGFGTLSFGKKLCHACKGKGYIIINLDREKDGGLDKNT